MLLSDSLPPLVNLSSQAANSNVLILMEVEAKSHGVPQVQQITVHGLETQSELLGRVIQPVVLVGQLDGRHRCLHGVSLVDTDPRDDPPQHVRQLPLLMQLLLCLSAISVGQVHLALIDRLLDELLVQLYLVRAERAPLLAHIRRKVPYKGARFRNF